MGGYENIWEEVFASGQDLYMELNEKVKSLDFALAEYRKRGIAHANARKEYQVALSKEIVSQRLAGLPVTIIADVCKGKEEIAELRYGRDVAESLHKSAGEAINAMKLQIRIIEGQIEREWGRR